MRQQAGLLQDPDRHRANIGQRVVVAVRIEPLAGLLPAGLGAIPESEERFLAAECGTLGRDRKYLVRRQERGRYPTRHRHERAVGAAIPAQPRERDEDLARVRDHAAAACRCEAGIPDPGGVRQQGGQVVAARLEQDRSLRLVERLAVPGPGQGPAQRGRARHRVRRRGLQGDAEPGLDSRALGSSALMAVPPS